MPHSSTKGRFLEKCLKSDKVRKKKSILKNLCQICGNLFFPAYYIGEDPVRGAVQSAVMYILSSENEKKESSHTTT